MPASWPSGTCGGSGAPSLTTQRTSPRNASGSDCAGNISLNRNIVPTSSGFSVLMKVPPFEMFFV